MTAGYGWDQYLERSIAGAHREKWDWTRSTHVYKSQHEVPLLCVAVLHVVLHVSGRAAGP